VLAADLVCDARAEQTAVRNQGTRPTCAVFAATAAHEWMAGDRPDLSEEDALHSAKAIDATPGEATWVASALRGVDRHGQALAEDWPYGLPSYPAPRPTLASDSARRRRCGAVGTATAARVADVALLLGGGRAAIITVRFVPATWAAATTDGWIDDPLPPVAGGHAVLAVGCVTAAEGQPDAVVFKNSWSARWGDHGYGFLTDRYLAAHHQFTDTLEASPS
jgi:hypothetical protein